MIGTSLLFSGSIGGLISPFDTIAPTAGYSLRALTLSYTGAVVRVRRSGDNEEKDFNSTSITNGTLDDFLITLGTDDHSKEILSDFEDIPDFSLLCACNVGRANELDAVDEFNDADGFVSKWYDQFGSNDATQTTAAEQPKIWDASTGLVTENGKPAIDFDGVDDLLLISDFAYSTTELATIVVQNPDSVTTDVILGHYRTDNNQRSFNVRFSNNSYGFSTSSNGTNFTLLASNESTTGQTLYFAQYDGSQTGLDRVKGYVNTTGITYAEAGISTESLPSSLHDSTASLSIGGILTGATTGSAFYDGNMQEIILYASDQSANRTDIEDNINNYYDIY